MGISAKRQPQGLVRLNRSNALGRKVIEYLPLNGQRRAIVSNASLTVGAGGSFKSSPKGVGLRSDGISPAGSIPLDLSKYSVITLAFWLYWDVYANNDNFAMEFTTNGNSTAGGFYVDPNHSTGNFVVVTNGSGANSYGQQAPRPAITGRWARVAFTMDVRTQAVGIFVDGVRLASSFISGGGVTAGTTFANSTLYLFSRANAALFGPGNLQDLTIYQGALTDAEIAQDYANPWQILDAPSQSQFPMAAAAPAGLSGSITWTEASDSAAAAGSVSVSGAAAWTEAADSAALAGSVGSAVGINAAWTEAADSVAIASTARVNAAAAWTEAADTISMAGSAGNSVAANISWTEAADVTTVAGTIRINAAGSWTEAGDTAAILVNVLQPASGGISWTEQADAVAIGVNVVVPFVAAVPQEYFLTTISAAPVSYRGAMYGDAVPFRSPLLENNVYASGQMGQVGNYG